MEDYEKYAQAVDLKALTVADILKSLMAGRGMTASDLGPLLGQREVGTKILKGQRALRKSHIARLAKHFHVSTHLFIQAQFP